MGIKITGTGKKLRKPAKAWLMWRQNPANKAVRVFKKHVGRQVIIRWVDAPSELCLLVEAALHGHMILMPSGSLVGINPEQVIGIGRRILKIKGGR